MSLLQNTRYRRYVLREDRGATVWVLGIAAAACAFYARNDLVLLGGTPWLWAALATRAMLVTACLGALHVVRTTRSPRRFDAAMAVACLALGVGTLAIGYTRNLRGEHLGQLITSALVLATSYFFLRGTLWYRVASASMASLATLLSVWSPSAQAGSVTRTSVLIGVLALNAFGILIARGRETERRKRFEAERKAAVAIRRLAAEKENALALSRTRTAFLTAMSHEFRTPMNAVIGLSEILAAGHLDPEQRDHARAIRDSARGLLSLLNDILDFAKIDAERLTLSPAPFEIRRLATSVVAMMKSSLEGRNLTLDLHVGDAVPDMVLLGDEPRLRQVLVNLLSNAVKFTETGRILFEITSRPRPGGAHEVRFSVADTGIGISPEAMTRLFRPFEQADQGIERRFGGTGLGLAISKRIVEAMGSEIHVKSEVGKGSEFSFAVRLPIATGTGQVSGTWARGGIPAPPMAILLVDDHSINRQVATAALRKLGQTPDLAADGHEAIAACSRRRYDLIFMDLQMPNLGGIEATRKILSASRSGAAPHIVAMTASVMETDRSACLAAGMRGFLGKPIEMGELAETLTRVSVERDRAPMLLGLPPSEGDLPGADPQSDSLDSARADALSHPLDEDSHVRERAPSVEAEGGEERDEAILDKAPLDALRSLSAESDPGFVASVCSEFLRDATARMETARAALERSDLDEIRSQAHTLRGGAATVGATGLHEILGRIEALALSGKGQDGPVREPILRKVAPLLRDAARELHRVNRALEREIRSAPPAA